MKLINSLSNNEKNKELLLHILATNEVSRNYLFEYCGLNNIVAFRDKGNYGLVSCVYMRFLEDEKSPFDKKALIDTIVEHMKGKWFFEVDYDEKCFKYAKRIAMLKH